MNVDTLINGIIQREGSAYTNDPDDAGGPTKYGITQATARANGYTGDMQNLTEDQARAIYKSVYWTRPKFDQLALIDEALAEKLLDIGVNRGASVGVGYLQRALNVFNYNGSPYVDLLDKDGNPGADGVLGSATFGAVKAFYNLRGAAGKTLLYQLIQALQAVGYVEIAEKNKTQEKYIYGWLTQRAFGV